MVMAVSRVEESVVIVPRPGHQKCSVYSLLEVDDHRRHKEEVQFRPVLHPVKYSDTAYVYINNTRKRYVTRTYYEPRVRPRSYAETTFTRPKTAEETFVSYLDIHPDEQRKWFKTSVEVKARTFKSEQILRSPNNNYLHSIEPAPALSSSHEQTPSVNGGLEIDQNGLPSECPSVRQIVKEKYDPGASQVFIPKQLNSPAHHQSPHLLLRFPVNGEDVKMNRDLEMNGYCNGYSDL